MKKRISLIVLAFALIAFASSCKKSSDNNSGPDANAAFIGTYYGTLVTAGIISNTDTITIVAGGNSTSIVMNSRTGAGSVYSTTGTVSGNNITIASQQVYVPSRNETYTVTGSGTLNSPSLQIDMTFGSTGLSFTGTKR